MNVGEVMVTMLPEHLLLAGIVVLASLECLPRARLSGFAVAMAAVAAATVAAVVLAPHVAFGEPFPEHFTVDAGAYAAKALLLALSIPVLLLSREEFVDRRFHILLLSSVYGACLVASSASFLTLFLGLELMSLPVYVLVLLAYRRPQSAEGALKYLVLGGAASAMLLMGASLLFGDSGSLGIEAFATALGSRRPVAWAGVALVVAALFVKGAIVPFHGWAPDAYEGASAAVTAYMATVIKGGVLLVALRLLAGAPIGSPLVEVIAVPALVSILWGNLVAMRQGSFRRMIAYSSIAHAGYLFLALVGDGPGRHEAILFYLAAYGLVNLLAFAALPRAQEGTEDRVDALGGLFSRDPQRALVVALAMLSLAGIPPLPGFVAKFLVFSNVMAAGHTAYAVAGLVASYVGIYFYLRVVQLMFMGEAAGAAHARRRPLDAAAVLCLVPALAIALFPGVLLGWF